MTKDFYSRFETAYNGDIYSIPFSYINREEIKVYIDNELYTQWQFLNESQIKFTSLPENITNKSIISVRRETNIQTPMVEYTNNTMLSKEALNLSQNQLLHSVQEIYDNNAVFEADTQDLIEQNKKDTDKLISDNKSDTDNKIEAFKTEINESIETFTSETNGKIDGFENEINNRLESNQNETNSKIEDLTQAVNKQINDNKKDTDKRISENKSDTDNQIQEFREEINQDIENFKSQAKEESEKLNKDNQTFKDEVNSKLDKVNDAAEKLDTLQDAVDTAINSSTEAQKAKDEALKASERALQSAEGLEASISEIYNQLDNKAEKEYVNSQIDSLSTKDKTLEEKITSNKGLIDSNTQKIIENENNISELQKQLPKTAKMNEEGLVTLDTVNQSKGMKTGNISTNPEIYEEIKNYAHSTFNKSLFTIRDEKGVIITDDGLASNFTPKSIIFAPVIKPGDDSWEVGIEQIITKSALNVPENVTAQHIFFTHPADVGINVETRYSEPNYDSFIVQFSFSDGSLNTEMRTRSTNGSKIKEGERLSVKLGYDREKKIYWFKAYKNGIEYVSVSTGETDKILRQEDSSFTLIGSRYSNPNVNYSIIDLKSYYVKYGDKIVYSGNKTDVDVIKPENYTVCGIPIISADGFANNFSAENYLYTPSFTFDEVQNLKIKMRFKTPKGVMNENQVLCYWGNSLKNRFFFTLDTNKIFSFALGESLKTETEPLEDDTYYDVECELSDNTLSTKYKMTDESTFKTTSNVKLTDDDIIQGTNTISFGMVLPSKSFIFTGGIDLNSFRIYKDGTLIYQPCLKIPYNLSKTGSKIVEAKYRNRVQDMYEQFGYAPYYTLDEENKNFTLPMGEVYGMMEKTRQNLDDILRPIGKPLISMNNDTLNFDEIWLEGDKVLKSTYPKLAEVYGDTYAPLEAEDTDIYLYLPDFRERTVWGSPDGSYGYIESGLPQHTHAPIYLTGSNADNGDVGNLVITTSVQNNGLRTIDNSVTGEVVESEIYGKTKKVQPPSFEVRWKTRYKA